MGLEELKAKLQDKIKGVHIDRLSENDLGEKRWLETPAYDLNRIVSGSLHKCFPSRSLGLLVAPEASFKSSMMALCGANAQKEGMLPIIFDTEGAWEPEFVERWGMNPENVLRIYTPWIDKVMTTLGEIINDPNESNMFIMLDSLGGLEKFKMINDAVGSDHRVKADQGTLQKEMKRMLKMLLNIVKGKDSIGLMSGHFFGNPNSYGGADEIGGGKFAKLAPDIIVSMRKNFIYTNPSGQSKEAKGPIIGSEVTACTLKNRYYPPFQECKIEIDYKNGINRYAGLLEIALSCGLVEKNGSWYSMNDERMGQGAVKATKWIAENPDKFLGPIEEVLKTTGYSTVNDDVEEAVRLAEEDDKAKPPVTKGRGKSK